MRGSEQEAMRFSNIRIIVALALVLGVALLGVGLYAYPRVEGEAAWLDGEPRMCTPGLDELLGLTPGGYRFAWFCSAILGSEIAAFSAIALLILGRLPVARPIAPIGVD